MSEFVPVSEAARRLGVSVRTAQRHTAKLDAANRETPESGQWRVNLSALADRLGKPTVAVDKLTSEARQGDASSDCAVATRRDNGASGVAGDASGREASSQVETELRARLADRERENVRLWDALQRAQENEQKALAELSETRRENMIILGSIASKQIPERVAPTGESVASMSQGDATNGVSVASGDTQDTMTGRDEHIVTDSEDTDNTPKGNPLVRWWDNVVSSFDRSRKPND